MSGEPFTVACVQNCAGTETEPNLKDCAELVREAAGRGAAFILLPEYFTGLDIEGHILIPEAFAEAEHPALPLFAGLARDHRAWILLGSLAITLEDGAIANRSYLLDPDGAVAARYDKIHLFDVDLPGGESYRESATIAPGACAAHRAPNGLPRPASESGNRRRRPRRNARGDSAGRHGALQSGGCRRPRGPCPAPLRRSITPWPGRPRRRPQFPR